VGYIRVSTEDQALSPFGQRAALEAWCERNQATLTSVHEDLAVSGGSPLEDRAGLMAAMDALLDDGAGVLLVVKRDRLARDVMIAGMLERLVDANGATIVSADGMGNGVGPEAELMRNIVNVFAQYERALIRFRTKAALAVKRTRGERLGELPYGKRATPEGKLEDDPNELRATARVLELRRAGTSIRGIAAQLNAEGVPARGSGWHKTTVERLLARADN
jgi:DNA invertase Pin-like site-specific DNA recombinase